MASPYQVLCISPQVPDLATSAFGPFVLHHCLSLADAAGQMQTSHFHAVWVDLKTAGGADRLVHWAALGRAVLDSAVLASEPEPTLANCLRLMQLGVRDVVCSRELNAENLGRSLRMAIERKRLEDTARRAYSIDLTTGLPNHHQLLEHMTHLLALREREPASMALIVLHLEGFKAAEASLGTEAANVLRRKAAVRLRASLRASDVVASLGSDMFAVLLAWIDADDDAERVAHKLLASVSQPISVTGQAVPMGAKIGVGQYPAHGKDAQGLLSRAITQAAGDGISRLLGMGAAANDEVRS